MPALIAVSTASEGREQVTARRVVDHVADEQRVGGTVRKTPVPFDEIDELQMMREVTAAADRQELGPGKPDERRQDTEDDDGKREQVTGIVSRRSPECPSKTRAARE